MTGISIALSLGTSLILVVMMNDKLMGRIIGQYIPAAILSLILYIFLAIKGKRIQIKYWKLCTGNLYSVSSTFTVNEHFIVIRPNIN